jgi:hypothetical protein
MAFTPDPLSATPIGNGHLIGAAYPYGGSNVQIKRSDGAPDTRDGGTFARDGAPELSGGARGDRGIQNRCRRPLGAVAMAFNCRETHINSC